MTDADDPPELPTDDDWVVDLVRRRLDGEADRVDPRPHFDRIRNEVAPSPAPASHPQRGRGWLTWLGPLLATAAALGLIFLGGWLVGPATIHASPTPRQIVEATQQVHRLPIDRCYLVETRRAPSFHEVFPNVPQMQTNRLWTRGDRFFIVPAEGKYGRAWGRDENGNLWIAPTPRAGIRVESQEIPPALATTLEMHTLRVDQLLGDVLRNFDLARVEEQSEGLPATEVVRATPRRGRFSPMVRRATLEIDIESKVLRRLVLIRGPFGKPVVTTTYTLVETRTLDTDRYSLEGHLREPFEVYTRENKPHRRLAVLRRMYGPMADRWFGSK